MLSIARKAPANKPLLLSFLMLIGLLAVFWLGSRYPDLGQKALMAGDTQLSALGFDLIVDMPPDPSVMTEIAVNAANWMYTNWKGMSFGLLAGALLLTILPHLQALRFQNRFANSGIGMLIGAPLGVCVNCATPVAQGAYDAGARPETALAMLVSSPTLNVIVVTMAMSLFPAYMAATKIGLTLVFVLLCLPVLTRFFPPNTPPVALQPMQADKRRSRITPPEPRFLAAGSGWGRATFHVLRESLRNLGYILRVALPLMVLAGVMGAAAITLLPFEGLREILPRAGAEKIIPAMVLLALFALVLPTPMSFDVIVVAVLFQAGLPAGYAMVMLFALGIFSVYPFMLIWRQMSRRLAGAMAVCLAGLAVTGGVLAHLSHEQAAERTNRVMMDMLASVDADYRPAPFHRQPALRAQTDLVADLQANPREPSQGFTRNGIEVEAFAQNTPANTLGQFTRIEGPNLGIGEDDNAAYSTLILPYSQSRGIAAADVHRDGWPDFVVGSRQGLGLYANLKGDGFELQEINIPQAQLGHVGVVSLIDFNNDHWPDLFFSVIGHGAWIAYNEAGRFSADRLIELPDPTGRFAVTSASFEDFDGDGDVDIFLGNSTGTNIDGDASFERARNVLLWQDGGTFRAQALNDVPAETLSSATLDLDGDGRRELIVGNDFKPRDAVIAFPDGAPPKVLTRDEAGIPLSTQTTMSVSAADIDNDLSPELFFAQIAFERGSISEMAPADTCAELENPTSRTNCEWFFSMVQMRGDLAIKGPHHCLAYNTNEQRASCAAYSAVVKTRNSYNDQVLKAEHCAVFRPNWPAFWQTCNILLTGERASIETNSSHQIPSALRRNFLYSKTASGPFSDVTDDWDLRFAGWAWNANFADLNNDSWQDLLVVTGLPTTKLRHSTNVFENREGKTFEDVTAGSGLGSHLDILSYSYVDFDLDGDLDIIASPSVGPILVYRNDRDVGKSVSFGIESAAGPVLGARVIIHYGDNRHQLREILGSGGFMSFNPPIAHFGLGQIETVDRIEVTLPGGDPVTMDGPFQAGMHYRIRL